MKKIYVLATAAIVAFASCMKTEIVSNSEPQEIAFRQFTGFMTKGDALTEYSSTMGVFAYHKLNETTTPYISNGQFKETSSTGIWGGNPTQYYWPLQGTMDFTVYAPHQETGVIYDGSSTLSVTITNNNTTPQVDYLYGKIQYKNQTKPVSPKTSVPVVLKHALSKVTINMIANEPSIFTVSSVLLKETVQNGSYTVSYVNETDNTSEVVPGETKANLQFVSSDWALVTEVGTNTASKLVVPSEQTSIEIKYKMAGSDAEAVLTANINLAGTTTPTPKWETGKHYIYNITLTADEILLAPTVEDWVDETASK